jgi:hypothetical protein
VLRPGLLTQAVAPLPEGAVDPRRMAGQLVEALRRARMTALQCNVGRGIVHTRVHVDDFIMGGGGRGLL